MANQTVLLLAVAALLCVVLVLVLQQPRKRAPRPVGREASIDVEIQCHTERAQQRLEAITATAGRATEAVSDLELRIQGLDLGPLRAAASYAKAGAPPALSAPKKRSNRRRRAGPTPRA